MLESETVGAGYRLELIPSSNGNGYPLHAKTGAYVHVVPYSLTDPSYQMFYTVQLLLIVPRFALFLASDRSTHR